MRRRADVPLRIKPWMRALHIGPTPFFSDRGCHVRISGLIRALERRRVECWLCTYPLGREFDGVETERIGRIPGYRRVKAGPSPFKYVADLLLLLKVCRSIRRRDPHVIHGHLHEGALIGWMARILTRRRDIPLVFDMQGSLSGELEEHGYFRFPPVRWLFRWIERRIDHLPDRIACSSDNSSAIAHERFGVPEERLVVVPDGTDVEPEAAEDATIRRADMGIPTGPAVVVYTGSLLPIKGLGMLQELIAAVDRAGHDIHFLIVGYPEDDLRRFLAERGLEGRCTITGRMPFERLGEHLAIADVAVEPKRTSSGEASGKLLNYMAAGLPIVCFDTPNNRSLLADVGCYAATHRVDDLVARIAELIADPELARRHGELGHDRARDSYSWDASAATLVSIYRDCLRPAGPDPGTATPGAGPAASDPGRAAPDPGKAA